MAWEKRGVIYTPSADEPWVTPHAQVPAALVMEDRIRIYSSVRIKPDVGIISYFDVDIKNPSKILYRHKQPVLGCGKPGAFDEFGTMANMIMRVENEVWLYMLGWQRQRTVPCQTMVGLVKSTDGGDSFVREFDGPLLSITRDQPYSNMAPWILRRGNTWQMWYGSALDWVPLPGGEFERVYRIHYAHSTDGINWVRPNICCVPGKTPDEVNTRASVVFENGLYHMWFSYRRMSDYRDGGSGSYRIGYATSKDGISWDRDDSKAGIDVSKDGWDSEMVTYPYIVDTPHGRTMFYNGNGFGMTGIGYAVWKG